MTYLAYRGAKTRGISFPLGDIGSGCIGLGGTGQLVDWEIFNRPAKGSRNGFSHFTLKAQAGGKVHDARVLHGDAAPPFTGEGTAPFTGFGFRAPRETLALNLSEGSDKGAVMLQGRRVPHKRVGTVIAFGGAITIRAGAALRIEGKIDCRTTECMRRGNRAHDS